MLVELKARFDEANNVNWAKAARARRRPRRVRHGRPEDALASRARGARDDGDQLRRYCHIGTGNYNSKTARHLRGPRHPHVRHRHRRRRRPAVQPPHRLQPRRQYRTLSCAGDLRRQLLELIEHEATFGEEGRITLKCNSLADRAMIEALYRASAAGVQIDLIVRGICCLRPACRACPRTSGCAASSAATSSTAGSTGSATAASTASRTVPHRVGRPDAAQPRPPGRGARADRAPEAHRVARPGDRRSCSPTTSCAGSCSPTTPGPGAAPRTFEPNAQERMYRWAVERQQAQSSADVPAA